MNDKEHLSLTNIGGGAVDELFQLELERVLDNILDINTEPTKRRSITIKVTILPSEDRSMGSMFIDVKPDLAPKVTYKTKIFIGREDGQPAAVEHNPKQMPLFDETTDGMKVMKGERK